MNEQNAIRAGKTLSKSTDYHGVIAERYWCTHLQRDTYRLKLPGIHRELWLSQIEMEHAVIALMDVWKTRDHPNRPRLDGEVSLASYTADTRDGGEVA